MSNPIDRRTAAARRFLDAQCPQATITNTDLRRLVDFVSSLEPANRIHINPPPTPVYPRPGWGVGGRTA